MTVKFNAGPQFQVTHFSEIAEEHHKSWLIDELLGAGEISVFYGVPGSGKSVLLGDGAAHVAAGLPWFGRPVTQGLVVYVAAERAALVKRRLAAWRKRHQVPDLPLVVVEGAFDLCSDTAHAAEIVRIAIEAGERYGQPVVWVIIDTKAQVMAGADPNSDKDTIALVASLMLIQRETGAHVTVADHVPHYAPERMKGSGSLAAAADGSFRVTKEGRGQHRLTIGSKPPNDGSDELDIAFALAFEVLGTDASGKVTKAPVVVASDMATPRILARGHKPKLKPGAAKVLAAFGRLYDADRTHPAPDVPGVRAGTIAVELAELQQMAFDLGLSADIEPIEQGRERDKWRNKRNQTWKRAVEDLEARGLLRRERGFAWEPGRVDPVTNGDGVGDPW